MSCCYLFLFSFAILCFKLKHLLKILPSIELAWELYYNSGIDSSLCWPICFELAGLQLYRYVSHFLCSFIFLRLQMVKDLNFAVNIAQIWKKCDEKALDLLFYFNVNFVSLFVRSAFAFASANSKGLIFLLHGFMILGSADRLIWYKSILVWTQNFRE